MKLKGKSTILFIAIALVVGFLGYAGAFGLNIGSYEFKSFDKVITKGLDLQGGVSVLQEVASEEKVSNEDLEITKELLSMRVNKLGVGETSLSTEGNNRIRVDIPGSFDSKSIVDTLTKTGDLKFVGPENDTILTGKDVKKATAFVDDKGQNIVSLELNEDGTKKFAEATEKYLHQNITIYMDEEKLTDPQVQSIISDGKATITGNRNYDEAKKLAGVIQSGALPVPLKTVSIKTVGPTLGATAIPSSLKAGLVGISLVFLFMILYYRVPGLLADIALTLYILLVLYAFTYIGSVLTLPGIAGFLLTIGMAVDANVLIFERIREELKTGKSIKSSIDSGFNRALSSILDSNITTIIAGIVLYYLGSGAVKGFALTLMVGVILSMFTAITITRLLVNLAFNMGMLSKPSRFGVKRG
ncbi:protein translocase subunit SecD [Clostridium algidicarnis]|uniref:protein translocase subunit SecD n=1 Tax=Clostridium algidicarnis TaxID=37659 RepID=UPI001C0D7588|nr:protein translocase subunit SecD [Clostridium algidicarnis]MBU3203049.1 protein translocase subunit SecD [Clostridium algidicarnis]MBU3205652.1 protein translocase subunit SecD [Clostridium algidicarnis]MBU3211203.1 protein translocase subunit SecD [Clostridium algidicarnis]MBU3222289.1 protein translocase subunit SecD [Clostridium algidicarnis]